MSPCLAGTSIWLGTTPRGTVFRRRTAEVRRLRLVSRRADAFVTADCAQSVVADANVGAVYVATPPASHLCLARLAAASRKPCLVEKPLARSAAEGRALVDAFRETELCAAHSGSPIHSLTHTLFTEGLCLSPSTVEPTLGTSASVNCSQKAPSAPSLPSATVCAAPLPAARLGRGAWTRPSAAAVFSWTLEATCWTSLTSFLDLCRA